MGDLIDLGAHRQEEVDGSANAVCPKCACQWWRSPGIVFDADDGTITGYAYPLTCTECGHEIGPLGPRRNPIGTPSRG